MAHVFGVRNETKSHWERRVPITPHRIRRLVNEHDLQVIVQPSARRVFRDKEFVRAGAELTNDLSRARVVFGVKEIPPEKLEPNTTYVFFSHVIKGQHYNMAMLARLMELGCTLIDYERVRDADDRRLIFFGRFAGLAGMIDSLWALGQRFTEEGLRTPFEAIGAAHSYTDLEAAKSAISAAGNIISRDGLPRELAPLIIGVAGYGNVASGVQEILRELPTTKVDPTQLESICSGGRSPHTIYQVTFREEHLVAPLDRTGVFDLEGYYNNPENYESIFEPQLAHLTALINCNYWDDRYPRLVTKSALRELFSSPQTPRMRLIGDLGCDIQGAVECTLKATDPGDPVYVWDPVSDEAISGVSGHGPVVLPVDILPAELPRDASEAFSSALSPFVPAIASADYSVAFGDLRLPSEILRAVILHRGKLTPEYQYLERFLA